MQPETRAQCLRLAHSDCGKCSDDGQTGNVGAAGAVRPGRRVASEMTAVAPTGVKVLLLGSESAFSGIVLKRLLESGVEVAGFVVHEHTPAFRAFESWHGEIPVVVAGTGPAVAAECGVPVIPVGSMHDKSAIQRVQDLAPDILLIACFPMILPSEWRAVPRQMCLNLHPSVLPAYRGPTPLFWQFREGERETGVTLHVVESGIDAGDIVAQGVMPLPVGARFSQVNARLAEMGAGLVVDMLCKTASGIQIPRTTQDEALASFQAFPKEADFRFDTHFTAERAFCFMRGTEEWGVPFEVDAGDVVLVLESAFAFHDDARMAEPFTIDGQVLRIRFSEGVLEALGRRLDEI